jgi:hypothetical protein
MGSKAIRSTLLTPEAEAVVVAFRWHTLLPLETASAACSPPFRI